MSANGLKVRTDDEEPALLAQAVEIVELLQRAVKLGYSITFTPEQLKALIYLLGEAELGKAHTAEKGTKA